ncbi:MAG: CHASE2 domain-containing protein [Fidelibacterota bacterium]|nr:MAG: CHASE2 domain-containing protein [Candidatus Neomarinimicrobiota bacterium]
MKEVVDGYEFRSYDSRFRAKNSRDTQLRAARGDFLEDFIDTVLIVDIDLESIEELGNYYRWRHGMHAELINHISTGEPKAVLFDVIFDAEPDPYNDTAFVNATYRAGNVYHAFNLSATDSLNFRYAMSAPPDGFYLHTVSQGENLEEVAKYYFGDPEAAAFLRDLNTDLIPPDGRIRTGQVVRIPTQLDVASNRLEVPLETAAHFPSGERFDHTFIGLLNASKGIGSVEFPTDPDGIIRRAPTAVYFSSAGQVYPTLTMAAIMDILDVSKDGLDYDLENRRLRMTDRSGQLIREIPTDEQGRLWVNYYGGYHAFRYIPYVWAAPDMIPAEYFKDRIILVGSSAPGLMDLRSTPVVEAFPGVEIHANVIMSILMNEFVRPISKVSMFWIVVALGLVFGSILGLVQSADLGRLLGGASGLVLGGLSGLLLVGILGLLIGGILGLLLGVFLGRLKVIASLLITLTAVAGWMLFVNYHFISALEVFEMIRPIISFGGTFLSVNLYQFLVLEKDKRFLRKTFSTYVSPELIEQMVESKHEPQLGGESGVRTAFFTDIQSFSSFSEILTAKQLVALLNEYLTGMTDILLNEGGTLDKFEGDAIVGIFGAPMPMEDHALRAMHTGLGMQDALAGLRQKWASEGDKWPELVHNMRMRIGIHSGEFVTGNMGTITRMNYTMMGDVVNTAARLEASAKQYGIYIQCTTESLNLAGPELFEWREIDKVRVVGKSEAVETVEIMAHKGQLDGSLLEMRDQYQEGMVQYRQQQWDQARKTFEECDRLEEVFAKRPATPSRVYIERCDYFKANPPGDDWDGSWTLTAK